MIRPLARLRSTSLPLAGACSILGMVIYGEADTPPTEPVAAAALPETPRTKTADEQDRAFAMPPLRSFADVLARPLFSETRRPPLQGAAASDDRSAAFSLVGIVISAHESHALVDRGQPPQLERVSEGQEIDGWMVEKILPDRVLLARAERRLEVKAKDPAATTPADPNLAALNAQLSRAQRGGAN